MKKTILVVEDEKMLLDAVKIKLNSSGLEVLEARSADEAMKLMKEHKVSAIWLDHYLLGQKTGLDFLAELKGDEHFKKVPVFVVSNTAAPDKKQSYISLGAEHYYIKANHRLEEIVGAVLEELKG